MSDLELFGLNIYDKSLVNLNVFNQGIINTMNAYSFFLYKHDDVFFKALNNSDIIIPDGESISIAFKLIKKKKVKKISGYDLLVYTLHELNQKKGKAFFLGSDNSTLQKIEQKLLNNFPNIRFATYNPGISSNIKALSTSKTINKINAFQPDVLFVSFGAPKQEIWIDENKSQLKAGTICGVGAAFSYLAGTKKRPSKFLIRLGLEGIIRTLKEPREQIMKDIKAYPNFIMQIVKELNQKPRRNKTTQDKRQKAQDKSGVTS